MQVQQRGEHALAPAGRAAPAGQRGHVVAVVVGEVALVRHVPHHLQLLRVVERAAEQGGDPLTDALHDGIVVVLEPGEVARADGAIDRQRFAAQQRRGEQGVRRAHEGGGLFGADHTLVGRDGRGVVQLAGGVHGRLRPWAR
ncbi:MAG: hypothetical protein ACK559_14735, partial [bacterium]